LILGVRYVKLRKIDPEFRLLINKGSGAFEIVIQILCLLKDYFFNNAILFLYLLKKDRMPDIVTLHLMIVHFPIALIMAGFALDLAGLLFNKIKCLSMAGFFLMILGSVAAVAAVTTGLLINFDPESAMNLIRVRHEKFAISTLSVVVISTLFRIWLLKAKKEVSGMKYISVGLYLVAFALVSVTGYLGGEMIL
jgi:uncharacterized membrane protein